MDKLNENPIGIELNKGIGIIRFIRPEIKNPLSIDTLESLEAEFCKLESNSNIYGAVFTGSGDTFAAGANLKEIAELPENKVHEFGLRGQNLMQKIYYSRLQTLAAIDGFCMGGALDLALACKTRIASKRSLFAHRGVNLGIITGWGGTQMLPRLIGEGRAMELFLTGRRLSADEALSFGLIDKIENKPVEASVSKLLELGL